MGGTSTWQPSKPALGSVNAVLVARARRHFVKDFPGPLSIKTVLEGKVAWRTDRRDTWVDDSSFLVLNDGEPYSMEIDVPEPVSTSCVFFAKGFVESLSRDISIPVNQRLDDPYSAADTLCFLSRLHPRSSNLVATMADIKGRVLAESPVISLEEAFLNLGLELLLHYEEIKKQIARIPAARASTRSELLARVAQGREFLHAKAYGRVTLAEAARAACLSPFHFHRTFARAFGKTPSCYVTELRLAKAVHLLKNGVSVTEACSAVGFESLGSFCTTFRKHFGVTPSSFRR